MKSWARLVSRDPIAVYLQVPYFGGGRFEPFGDRNVGLFVMHRRQRRIETRWVSQPSRPGPAMHAHLLPLFAPAPAFALALEGWERWSRDGSDGRGMGVMVEGWERWSRDGGDGRAIRGLRLQRVCEDPKHASDPCTWLAAKSS